MDTQCQSSVKEYEGEKKKKDSEVVEAEHKWFFVVANEILDPNGVCKNRAGALLLDEN